MTSSINDATSVSTGTSNRSLPVPLDLVTENQNLSPRSQTASTPANEVLLDSFLVIPPLTFAPPKEIRAAKHQPRVQGVIGTIQSVGGTQSVARTTVAENVCKNSNSSRTRTVSKFGTATSESFSDSNQTRGNSENGFVQNNEAADLDSVPGMDKFDRLLQSVGNVADGALKDLHFAALEGILSADMPVEKIQSLIPAAGKQFCDLLQDAEQGGQTGMNTIKALREFQSQLTKNFDVKMEMSDRGLLLSEERVEDLDSVWLFVPTNGSIQTGVQSVQSGQPLSRSLDSSTVLPMLRNKLASALDLATAS